MEEGANLERRNPGPSWGYALFNGVNQILPWSWMRLVLKAGSLVGFCIMKEQRRHSRRFLKDALGREPGWVDVWKHFTAFAEFLARRFDAANGREADFMPVGKSDDRIWQLTEGGKQALFGTFHFGYSDLMGFWLTRFGLSIRMVRFQVGNSKDLGWLEKRFGEAVAFLWVNRPGNILFALKEAIEEGHSIAMKCDRIDHSSKLEVFEFLGKKRRFPFTIYHLSILFDLPVIFAFGTPIGHLGVRVHTSQVYYPSGSNKHDKLQRARIHFQETLDLLGKLVKEQPFLWFNFLDAIPVAGEEGLGVEKKD